MSPGTRALLLFSLLLLTVLIVFTDLQKRGGFPGPLYCKVQPGSGVPGWGIALLVLVCILTALAIIYLVVLTVCQCRQKNYGQLDIFPARDAYHPMSEYPTYHTHGRYVPPGSTKPNPYEVSAGNGGSSLSYTNLAATSANL
uniref:Mucin 1, cell surface associated n=1 Tax=Rousettus aegyptiacus TaxID=9407 RepID=A0A7J8BER7_ROUAE|nr:mucin 1, cell surface associated [Rousettus aegyptiacus]